MGIFKQFRINIVFVLFSVLMLLPCSVTYAASSDILITRYQTQGHINIRSGPGTDYDIVSTCESGVVLTVFKEEDGWGKIYMNDREGWVCLELLARMDASPVYATGTYQVSVDQLCMRQGPFRSYESCGMLVQGDVVEVPYIENDSWGKIHANGTDGWIDLSYTVKTESAPAADTPSAPQEVNVHSESSGGFLEAIFDFDTENLVFTEDGSSDFGGFVEEAAPAPVYEPGWSILGSDWIYADGNGQLIYQSNSLHDAWNRISYRNGATEFYLVVNCSTNEVFIFKGSKDNWVPYVCWQCCTGKPGKETVKGDFKVLDKGYSFGEPKYSCYYYTEFYPKYLFHSVLYEADTFNILDGSMGQNVSNGCVRLDLDHAKWIYDNIPLGTNVLIY